MAANARAHDDARDHALAGGEDRERSRDRSMERRTFLKAGALAAVAAVAPLSGCSTAGAAGAEGETVRQAMEARQWGFVIDVEKLNASGVMDKIVQACHHAHNVPDTGDPKTEIKWIWEEGFEHSFSDIGGDYLSERVEQLGFPILCNHCEEPPCVRLCPTEATFKRADGIVAMDYHRCIGCRFCMAGCPYGARSLNFFDPRPYIDDPNPDYPTRSMGVVEKCTLCSERIDQGLEPLCAELSEGAIVFGDLTDPESPARKALAEHFTIRRRVELGTGPSVYYIVNGGEAHA